MMKSIKNILLTLSNTERSVYERASDSAQRKQLALGSAVALAPLLSMLAMWYLLYVALGSALTAIVVSIFWGGS